MGINEVLETPSDLIEETYIDIVNRIAYLSSDNLIGQVNL